MDPLEYVKCIKLTQIFQLCSFRNNTVCQTRTWSDNSSICWIVIQKLLNEI